MDKKFLSQEDLMERWGVNIRTLKNLRRKTTKNGPAYTKIGGKCLYLLDDILKFEEQNKRVYN